MAEWLEAGWRKLRPGAGLGPVSVGRDRKNGIWFEVCSWVVCGRFGKRWRELLIGGLDEGFRGL